MTIKSKRHTKGIITKPTTTVASEEGEQRTDSSSNEQKIYLGGSERTIVTEDQAQTLSNKSIDSANNAISIDADEATVQNLEVDNLKAGVLDTDLNAVSASDDTIPSAKAVKDYVDQEISGKDEASEIAYDNSTSGLTPGANVQEAIDSLDLLADNHIAATGAHGVATVAGVTETQTLTNKTLTSPILNSPEVNTPSKLEVKQDTLANLETYALTATNGQLVFATDEKEMFQVIDNELEPVGGGGATSFKLNQVAHGFSVGDGIYHNGTSFVKGQADDADTLAYYVVVEVSDDDNIIAADFGRIEVPSHGFTVGQYYFLSSDTAGLPTTTEPATGFSNPLFYVESTDFLQVKVYRPAVVGQDVNINELSDVQIASLQDKDILTYDSGSGTWKNESRNLVQTQAILDAQTNTVISGITLDTANHRGFRLSYQIYRDSDTTELSQSGTLHITYKPNAGTFALADNFAGDDAGITFSAAGTQLRYSSDTLAGTPTTQELRIRLEEEL